MCRRARPELDDFYAFYSVKACSYLGSKKLGRFDSNSEKDMVTRLIGDAWRIMSRSGKLVGLSAAGKMKLFKSWPVAFPFFDLPAAARGKILTVDFQKGFKVGNCDCGLSLNEGAVE